MGSRGQIGIHEVATLLGLEVSDTIALVHGGGLTVVEAVYFISQWRFRERDVRELARRRAGKGSVTRDGVALET